MVQFTLSQSKWTAICSAIEIAYEMCAIILIEQKHMDLYITSSEVFGSSYFQFHDRLVVEDGDQNESPPKDNHEKVIVRCEEVLRICKKTLQQSMEIFLEHNSYIRFGDVTCKHVPLSMKEPPYFELAEDVIKCDARTSDLASALLCMCLGNGFFQIVMNKDGNIVFVTKSESGNIEVQVQTNLRTCEGLESTFCFVTKYLKHFLTTLQPFQRQCDLSISPSKLIVQSKLPNKISHQFSIQLISAIS